jgi:hypothetical protein
VHAVFDLHSERFSAFELTDESEGERFDRAAEASSGSGARCLPCEDPMQLRERLAGARTRLRGAADIDFQIKTLLEKHNVARYFKVERTVREDHIFKQARRGHETD